MFFLYTPFLYLLLLPLGLFLLSFMQREGLERFFTPAVLKQISSSKGVKNSPRKYRLFLLAIALFILSLARPITDAKNFSQTASIPLVIAIDVSKSMQTKDIYPNRLTFAKEKVQILLAHAKNLQIGILFFTKSAYLAYPISENLPAIAAMLRQADLKQTPGEGTNIFAAIEGANELLQGQTNKNILLLSDGGKKSDFKEESAYLKQNNLSLYSIGIGSENTKKLSLESGALYENYTLGSQDIDKILARIQREAQRKATSLSKTKAHRELFAYPLFLALLLLLYIFSSFKNTHLLLLFAVLQSIPNTAEAGLLDFYKISKAQNCYKEKNYKQAIALYKTLPPKKETLYNLANALYKEKEYKQALKMYKKALSNNRKLNAKTLHNIANCYFQQKKLTLAKKYYEKSFAISKNSATKENLDITNKILQRLKKQKSKNKTTLKGFPKLSIWKKDAPSAVSSNFTVTLQNVVLSEEQKWMQLLKHKQTPLFLRKLDTKRISKNAQNDF